MDEIAELLTIDDVARILGVPKANLYNWRWKGVGPPSFRVGKFVRYRPEDVNAWLDSLPRTEGTAS